MSQLKICPACGREFLKGMRCLVKTKKDRRIVRRLACLRCAKLAERIIVEISSEPCTVPGCEHRARICDPCNVQLVVAAHAGAVKAVAEHLTGIVAAMKATVPKETDSESIAFLDGRIQGLETALGMLLRGSHKGSTV